MRRCLFLLVLMSVGTTLCTFGQGIALGDFEAWTHLSQDSSSNFFYPKLLHRFMQGDTTLSDDELVLLNHGYTLRPEYSPYGQGLTEDSLYQYNREEKFAAALEAGNRYLLENPVSLRANIAMVIACRRLGLFDDSDKYQRRIRQLMRAILATGSGRSPDSAYAVINVRDEYVVLNYLGYSSSSQSLIRGKSGRSYDKLEAVSRKGSSDRKVFYFDITRAILSFGRDLK